MIGSRQHYTKRKFQVRWDKYVIYTNDEILIILFTYLWLFWSIGISACLKPQAVTLRRFGQRKALKNSVNNTNNFLFSLFSLFCLIWSFNIFITIVWSHNSLWYDGLKKTRPTQQWAQYCLFVIFTIPTIIVSVLNFPVCGLFHIILMIITFYKS